VLALICPRGAGTGRVRWARAGAGRAHPRAAATGSPPVTTGRLADRRVYNFDYSESLLTYVE